MTTQPHLDQKEVTSVDYTQDEPAFHPREAQYDPDEDQDALRSFFNGTSKTSETASMSSPTKSDLSSCQVTGHEY